jgi:hypothetical protein
MHRLRRVRGSLSSGLAERDGREDRRDPQTDFHALPPGVPGEVAIDPDRPMGGCVVDCSQCRKLPIALCVKASQKDGTVAVRLWPGNQKIQLQRALTRNMPGQGQWPMLREKIGAKPDIPSDCSVSTKTAVRPTWRVMALGMLNPSVSLAYCALS